MHRSDFYFGLPENLIAQTPYPRGNGSRLLMLNKQTGSCHHHRFQALPNLIRENDLLIFNDTQVIPARLFGTKATGGQVKILIERIVGPHQAWVHLGASKPLKAGDCFLLACGISVDVLSRKDSLFLCQFHSEQTLEQLLDAFGVVPLPPYIKRPPEKIDLDRYQTIFAKHKGAVAAPTAGLHFDAKLFQQLKERGVDYDFITLHVGAGTFKPVYQEDISQHKMHSERVVVTQSVCDKVNWAKAAGRRIIAVGTTVVRCLEALGPNHCLQPYCGDINIFIYPGYLFKMIDGMLTNFHIPESSLLMLVCAFAGYKPVMSAYQLAITAKYRFYSYGDAMLII